MTLEGSLREGRLVDVLLAVGDQGTTGILTVQGDQEIIGISFLEGHVVSADALNQTLDEGLGEVLAAAGQVSPEDFSALAAEHQAGGGRVIDLLVERSYLTRDELLEALRAHTLRLARQVLRWHSGEFKFYRGDEVAFEGGLRPITVEELLIGSGDDGGGPLGGTMPTPETVFEPSPGLAGAGDLPPAEIDSKLLPGERARELLALAEKMDGRRTAAELAGEAGIDLHRALFDLHRGRQAGLVQERARPAAVVPPVEPEPVIAPVVPAPPPERPARRPWLRLPVRGADAEGAPNPWPGRVLGLGLFALLLAMLAVRPGSFLFPYPWHQGMQREVVAQQTEMAVRKVDLAARSFFLLEGRFPDRLGNLVDEGLLTPREAAAPGGRAWDLVAAEADFEIRLLGQATPGLAELYRGSASGNFLLDPDFLTPDLAELPPLILLD